MKTTFLICGVVISTLIAASPAKAQYNARNLTRKVNPQRGAPGAPNQPRPPAQPALPPTPPAPPSNPVPAPAQAIRRAPPAPAVVARPIDPEKERAAKEETERKALEFEMKRADEDFGWAQYALGMRYLKGNGVDQNAAQGRKWLEKAAKNGESRATRELTKLDKERNEPADAIALPETKPGKASTATDNSATSKSGEAGKK